MKTPSRSLHQAGNAPAAPSPLVPLERLAFCRRASSMSAPPPAFLLALLVVLVATLTPGSRATRWPRPPNTKKPPRNGSGSVARTTTPSTSAAAAADVRTDQTTELVTDPYSASPPEGATHPSDVYPTGFQTDAPPAPGNTRGNYTLDYSECYFNFCECCPPERGPAGPLGERGLPGPAGERGPRGAPIHTSFKGYHMLHN